MKVIGYHGTNIIFSSFEESKIKKYPGFWFSGSKEYASEHGNYILQVSLTMNNPFNMNIDDNDIRFFDMIADCFHIKIGSVCETLAWTKDFRDYLIDKGYDSMIWEHKGYNT